MLVFTCPDLLSFVYDSETKSKISKTGFLHNSAVRLATATFCVSRLDSLHVKSEKPALLTKETLPWQLCGENSNF
jgi:hypothetical protein